MKAILFILLSMIYLNNFGQVVFEKLFPASNNDEINQVEKTNDGGYIFAGGTYGLFSQIGDMYFLKTNYLGDTIWTKKYGGISDEYCFSFKPTSDNGYILAGTTNSFGAGDYDVYLVKTDSIGDTVWTKTIGGPLMDKAYSITVTYDSGFVFCGSTSNTNGNSPVLFIGKTDLFGDTLWTKTILINGDEIATSIIETSDSNLIIAGGTNNDALLIKLDKYGNTIWTKIYGGQQEEILNCVIENSSGQFLSVGRTQSFGQGSADYYLLYFDTNGDTILTRTFGTSGYDEAKSIIQTNDSGYAIIGNSYDFLSNMPVFLIKTDSQFDTLWSKTYQTTIHPHHIGNSIKQTNDSGYVILGYAGNIGANNSDFYLIKTRQDGKIDSIPSSLNKLNGNLVFSQFPNPCTDYCWLEFNNFDNDNYWFLILNSLGQIIKRERINIPKLEIDGTKLENGIYLFQVFRNTQPIVSKKLVVCK